MKKMILMMALASVAVPALADPPEGWHGRGGGRGEHAQQQQQPAPAPRAEQPRGNWQRPQAAAPQAAPTPQQMQAYRGPRGGGTGFARGDNFMRGDNGVRQAPQGIDPAQIARFRERQQGQVRTDPYRGQQYGQYGQQYSGQPNYRQQYSGQQYRGQRTDGQRWNGGQWQGQQARRWDGDRDGRRWSNNWRQDPRYDWQRYRDRNRSIFRLGTYYDPFGYDYRPLSIGFTLDAGYYAPNFWLDNPNEYRLPPVYGPYRWVRYYDDAVLVDIYSGEVVDVIQGFFY